MLMGCYKDPGHLWFLCFIFPTTIQTVITGSYRVLYCLPSTLHCTSHLRIPNNFRSIILSISFWKWENKAHFASRLSTVRCSNTMSHTFCSYYSMFCYLPILLIDNTWFEINIIAVILILKSFSDDDTEQREKIVTTIMWNIQCQAYFSKKFKKQDTYFYVTYFSGN